MSLLVRGMCKGETSDLRQALDSSWRMSTSLLLFKFRYWMIWRSQVSAFSSPEVARVWILALIRLKKSGKFDEEM